MGLGHRSWRPGQRSRETGPGGADGLSPRMAGQREKEGWSKGSRPTGPVWSIGTGSGEQELGKREQELGQGKKGEQEDLAREQGTVAGEQTDLARGRRGIETGRAGGL